MTPQWQKRRSEFNHDWLKNKYIPKLGAWINLLDGKIENPDLEKSYISSVLPDWEYHQEEALALPEEFEAEMSPRVLFKEPPLSNCDDDTKQWLGDSIHHLWLIRYSVKKLVSDALESVKRTNDAYNRLKDALTACPDTSSAEELKSFRHLFFDFLSCCRALSEAIEKFPSEVRAV